MSRGLASSYVVITYNRVQHALSCIRKLYEQDVPEHEIIVVDNGSQDGTVSAIRSAFPNVHLIGLNRNIGVAGARNEGIRAARGDICILVDDDACFASAAATSHIVRLFASSPGLGVVAFCIRSSATGELERRAIPKRDKRSQFLQEENVAYFTGAGFAISRAAFNAAGPFWEKLFYVGEELDLSYRLLSNGFSIWYAKGIEILHDATPDARPSGQYIYFNARNRPWVALRNLPVLQVLTTGAIWWLYLGLASLKQREFLSFIRGVWHSLRDIPIVLRERIPVAADDLNRIYNLSGRVWY